MRNLKIALVQTDLVWHNAKENTKHILDLINKIKPKIDLVVLPEMFSTGFTMYPFEVAEPMDGETVTWMQNIASERGFAICGSVVIEDKNKYYNRFIFAFPTGEIEFYNKRHLFSLAGEEKVYSAGKEKVIIDYKGWKICPQVCYDLRFPVFVRNIEVYDLLLYVANWPKKRIVAWDSLLKARSIENMCYTVGVNRVGVDVNNFEYIGHSITYDCLGEPISKTKLEKETVEIVTLNKSHLSNIRNRFNFLNDKDEFKLQL